MTGARRRGPRPEKPEAPAAADLFAVGKVVHFATDARGHVAGRWAVVTRAPRRIIGKELVSVEMCINGQLIGGDYSQADFVEGRPK